MKLFEYQGKDLFRQYGIEIPNGVVIERMDELERIDIPFPWVMKAQVLVGGRGKAGGIKIVENMEEALQAYDEIMNMEIKGEKVKKVLVEEKKEIKEEMYLSFFLDRSSREYLMMFSHAGGMEIEAMKENIQKIYINPLIGIQDYHLRKIPKEVRKTAYLLFKLFVEKDCELAEINPLAIVDNGVIALDSKIIIDDNSLYRHKAYERGDLTPLEKEAREKGISFVQLDGNIGVIANGAGLTMATLDALNHFNGRGGVFLDLGGTDDPEKVKQALEIMVKAKPDVILINLFGGITKCDTVAKGIIEFMENHKTPPIVARIKGVNEDIAREMLKDYVITVDSFRDVAKKAAEIGG